jgi:hypothetical protein
VEELTSFADMDLLSYFGCLLSCGTVIGVMTSSSNRVLIAYTIGLLQQLAKIDNMDHAIVVVPTNGLADSVALTIALLGVQLGVSVSSITGLSESSPGKEIPGNCDSGNSKCCWTLWRKSLKPK